MSTRGISKEDPICIESSPGPIPRESVSPVKVASPRACAGKFVHSLY